MQALTFLGVLTAGTAGLLVLDGMAARVKASRQRSDQATQPSAPRPHGYDEAARTAHPAIEPTDAEATAWHWWKQLLTLQGMLGLFAGPVQVPILVINSSLIAATLETVLQTSGMPLIPVNIAGWEREITNLDLIGLLISLGQMLSASALHLSWHKRLWFPWLLALVALPALGIFEVWASFERGWVLEATLHHAALNALQALGMAALAAVVGCFLIDCFLLPLVLAVFWSLAAPGRCLARWWGARPVVRRPLVPALVAPWALLDAIFVPLRAIDRLVGRLIFGRRQGPAGEQKPTAPSITPEEGEHEHAVLSITTQDAAREYQSVNGHGSPRVWDSHTNQL